VLASAFGLAAANGVALPAFAILIERFVSVFYLDTGAMIAQAAIYLGIFFALAAAMFTLNTLQGVAFTLQPGPHTIQIDARDAAGIYYYRKSSSLVVNAAETTQQVFSLDWLVGTVPIRFTFSNGITQLSCAQAGVTTVQVTLRDSSNVDYTQDLPCMLGNFDGYTPYIYAGTYTVFAAAVGTAGAQYNNFRPGSPAQPTVTSQAGVFPPLMGNSTAVFMSVQ
jgi:hypothetical protein